MFNETVKNPSVIAILGGLVASPFFVPVAVTTAVLGSCYLIFKDDDEEEEDEQTVANSSEGVKQPLQTVQTEEVEQLDEPYAYSSPTVHEPFDATVNERLNTESSVTEIDVPSFTDEEIQAEMRRKVMSDMGKRSGEARRRKKQLAM
ncbi:MAG: hypothetical protein ACI9TY_000236 [Alphaproteobacteria bacterium]|jgi:hypothetical protein